MLRSNVPSRDVFVCPWCQLQQFVGTTNVCRRCRKPLPFSYVEIPLPLASSDPHTLSILIGTAIRTMRVRRGLSQSVLASKANMNRTHLSRIERAKLTPSIALLVRVSAALSVDRLLLRVRGLERD